MFKTIISLLFIFSLVSNNQVLISNSCTCNQLFTQYDCFSNSTCQWNITKSLCINKQTPVTNPQNLVSYCNQFLSAASCAQTNSCLWNEGYCTFFTGCTAFTYDTDQKCQVLSKKCLSDGVHCVEFNVCSAYQTQKSCSVNSNGKYCYWNVNVATNPICEDADDCQKLPIILNSDSLCRAQIAKCTISQKGGCIESGMKCQDQITEISCVTNKDRTMQCFWDQGKCQDKTCDNAITQLSTDKECKDFLPICTTKQGGGCVIRTSCSANVQAACFTDNSGGDCFWNGNQCVDKTCDNALKTSTTNTSCQQYLSKCITNGAGCVDNTGCKAAKIKEACDQTLTGQLCNWDGTSCKIKTCENSGPSYVGHDQCTAYMSTCTAKGSSGCTDRTCDNAPLTNITNDLCKQYYSNGNCITKNGGGCKLNKTCEEIDIEIACITDINGQICFWEDGNCRSKTCENSTIDNNTFELCQAFSPSCTSDSKGKCVDKICENIIEEENCTYDLNQKKCIYMGKCYQKQCKLASTNMTTHEQCQEYLSSCTLDNSGQGCMIIPQKCENIINQKSCKIKSDGSNCKWRINKCTDDNCEAAPKDGTLTTSQLCDEFQKECVVNNSLNGCMELPKSCKNRNQIENCTVEQIRGQSPKCEWDNLTNPSNPVFIEISCYNAHLVTLQSGVTYDRCQNYFSLKCVIAKIGETSVCIPRPNNCVGLIQETCQKSQVLIGDQNCYWDNGSNSCKTVACSSITFANGIQINHNACFEAMDKCTVDAEIGTKCIPLKNCRQYLFSDQCKQDQSGLICVWMNGSCIIKPCEGTSDSDQFDSDQECQDYSSQCKLTTEKCSLKQTNCANYLTQSQCEMHVLNRQQQCAWSNGTCSNATGSFDCTLVTGVGLTFGYCQSLNFDCSVNVTGTACIVGQLKCSSYSQENECKQSTRQSTCKYINDKCVLDCQSLPGPFTELYCEYNSYYFCGTNFDRTGCINVPSTCGDNDIQNCILAQDQRIEYCYPQNNECKSSKTSPLGADECGLIDGTYRDLKYCQFISDGNCTVNLTKTSCIEYKFSCSAYLQKDDCGKSIEGDCFWSISENCIQLIDAQCTDFTGSSKEECQQKRSSCSWSNGSFCELKCDNIKEPQIYDQCKQIDKKCINKLIGSGCAVIATTCTETTHENCTGSQEGPCYWMDNNCINSDNQPLSISNCNQIIGNDLNYEYCQSISQEQCSVNSLQTNCVEKKQKCSDYNEKLADCYQSNESKCVLDKTGTQCISYWSISSCEQIKLFGKTNDYLDFHCSSIIKFCKATSDGTGCELNIDCGQYKGINLSYYNCVDKSIYCSVNADKTACVIAKYTCAEYSSANCSNAINEGECIVQNNVCVQKQCNDASTSITDMNGCQNYSLNCIKKIGGCENKSTCSKNLTQENCLKRQDCLWNPTLNQCVNRICFAAEETTYFDTHTECQTIGKCTVNDNGQGCIPLAACNTYQNSEQCKMDNQGMICYWVNQDLTNQYCTAEKSCLTASSSSYNTHQSCQGYMDDCTVYINGAKVASGCTPLKKCSDYLYKDQCFISIEKDESNKNVNCGWNGLICTQRSCATAQTTENDHQKCSQYFQGCTVNSTDDGCTIIPDQCEGMTKNQCFDGSIDSNNRKCIWSNDNTKCVTKKCENSPNFANENECQSYLSECTIDTQKCKTEICEYHPFTTDDQCKLALPMCTTDGITCVKRGTCGEVKVQVGCVSDSNGQLCQWVTSSKSYCTNRTCENAPQTLKTESECQTYFTPAKGTCTTQKNGGCISKTTCNAASVQSACTKDSSEIECIWDNENQQCRYKQCKDFQGLTHQGCNKLNILCTIGLNGKCTEIVNCEQTSTKEACIEGKNGPCLWIQKYINNDGSSGACFKYESCKSLDWKTDSLCKLISPHCTTNGQQCVAITSCIESNKNGGCKTGTDGECIQTVSIKGANDKICQKFISCNQAYYLTHEECYEANSNCTSDYSNGCISLNACNSYTKEGQCVLNKEGIIKDDNGSIISTGQCRWDSTNNQCRDKQCKDILKTTESDCAAELKTCSSDGTTCILKGTCNSYMTQNACNFAKGTDGNCFWVDATETQQAFCRIKICSDIKNGATSEICSEVFNCIFDGTNCINKGNCSSYKTQTACMAIGIDGFCIWTGSSKMEGKCTLMSGCKSASDEFSCKQVQICNWNSFDMSCTEHTCESFKAQANSCTYYSTWDIKKYNVCSIKDEKCISTDATSLNERDCYSLSAQTHSWNPSSQKCSYCKSKIPNVNDQKNNSDVPAGQQTSLEFKINQILPIAIWLYL